MKSRYEPEKRVAVDAVRLAARVCGTVQAMHPHDSVPKLKEDGSPATVADYAAQAVVGEVLQRQFPIDVVVGEENTRDLHGNDSCGFRRLITEHAATALEDPTLTDTRVLDLIELSGAGEASGQRFWTLDPVDGTKGFLRHQHYAVALALIEHGEVVLGALACPELPCGSGKGAVLVAEKGHGAIVLPLEGDGYCGSALRTSSVEDASAARFCESVEPAHSNHNHASRIAVDIGITKAPVRIDSQAKYACVACGNAELYMRLPTSLEYREKIWDHAAGTIIVVESGGCVTDANGTPLDFTTGRRLEHNSGVVVSNSLIHDQVIESIQRLQK